MSSCIGVAWSALYSDSTRDHRKRVKGIKFAQLASLCSVNVITVTEKVSRSLEDFEAFQIVCVALAIISLFCLFLTGRLANAYHNIRTDANVNLITEKDEMDLNDDESKSNKWSWQEIYALTMNLDTNYDTIYHPSITVHATSPLFNILLSEVIEEDKTRYSRRFVMAA
uniref:Transmembrane protein n=1 Tax=Meloidogyne hapla TaxID=6305 RepID=A0A1I8B350_MELHA